MSFDPSTAITLYGIQCWEERATESFGRSAASATRVIVCRWADRFTVVAGLKASTPAAYPDATWLKADTIDVAGVVDEGGPFISESGMIGYAWARLTVVYRAPDVNDPATAGPALSFATDLLAVAPGEPVFAYASDGAIVPAEASPALRQTIITFTRKRRNLSAAPVSLVLSLVDTVNSATFEGAAAGTVRFEGATTERCVSATGGETWDVTYTFAYRRSGWNAFPRASTGGDAAVVLVATGEPPYAAGDFGTLFA
jgi:hypothetical protein